MRFEQTFQAKQLQKQEQKFVLTQQLQQSIQILQYNHEELYSFLETKSLENPLLDVVVSADYVGESFTPNYSSSEDKSNYINHFSQQEPSLFEHLISQIHLNYRETYLRSLILFLTEYIDVNGYLKISLEEAMEKTGATYLELLDALTLLQQLDPAGVGARNLQECLLLQIERDDTAPNLAYIILEEEFENFAQKKWAVISKKYEISLGGVQTIFDFVQTLTPFPGVIYGTPQYDTYIYPDILITISDQTILVQSTKKGAPSISFQQTYFDKMKQVEDQEVQKYMDEKKAEFDWIQKSLVQRGDTILRVAKEIVKRQGPFFLEESRPLFPLTLKQIASTLQLHESSVSRAVNGKYMQTPFGIFELRSFFQSGLVNQKTEEFVSSDTVKKKIQVLIQNENKAKPLSDQKLVDLLNAESIQVSRRTIAKYREALGIAGSTKRKRYDTKE
ncbi:RNA polymerase factor sigma-54 [Vagococcus entomophilus]|uniref:RNA polymerase sigma-54 factor n=1 Tax=Vagococcus entomophilus TaxID=1160095 RepID=A0A430AIX3_9ENTE|nr:RNA polymerase factor sigma-54 [Vagococcus entomophilus]RSU07867.1 RNA polymerase sigma-54 factor [Vagococcus entomophilus]